MDRRGILVDYHYCSGCLTCEMACQVEHGFPIGQTGIKVTSVGPWEIEGDIWQHDYIPALTDQCDLCANRTEKGEVPTCVKHCMASVLTFGKVDEILAKAPDHGKQVLFIR